MKGMHCGSPFCAACNTDHQIIAQLALKDKVIADLREEIANLKEQLEKVRR